MCNQNQQLRWNVTARDSATRTCAQCHAHCHAASAPNIAVRKISHDTGYDRHASAVAGRVIYLSDSITTLATIVNSKEATYLLTYLLTKIY